MSDAMGVVKRNVAKLEGATQSYALMQGFALSVS